MRLDAYLCRGGYTRNEAQRLIKIKTVSVNGTITNVVSFPVKKGDCVTVDGEEVWGEETIYLAMNKPAGFVCTTDPGEDCVLNLVPKSYRIKGLSLWEDWIKKPRVFCFCPTTDSLSTA